MAWVWCGSCSGCSRCFVRPRFGKARQALTHFLLRQRKCFPPQQGVPGGGGGTSALNSQIGVFSKELGNDSVTHTQSAVQSKRQAKTLNCDACFESWRRNKSQLSELPSVLSKQVS